MNLPFSSLKRVPRSAVLALLSIMVCFVIIRPLSNYFMNHRKPQVFDSKVYFSGDWDSDNPYASGNRKALSQRERRKETDGKWWSFGSRFPFEGYMYSAFYDDRKSLGTLPQVRIIAVMEDFGKLDMTMYCMFYYKATNRVEYLKVRKADIGAGVSRHSKTFIEYILSCKLPHEEIPDRVGIVSNQGMQAEATIPVEVTERRVKAQHFGVCISVSYWKIDPYHIVEWMELLRILGVSGVTVYNNSLEYDSARVFIEYAKEGFVEFRQSHNFMPDEGELTIHMHMSPVINDCMYRNMYKYRKIIVTDFDELIVPRNVDNYYDMIEEIDKKQIPDNHEPAKHYLFRNNYFFVDLPEDTTQPSHLLSLRHRTKVEVSEPGYSIKSIIDPLSCVNMHNHYCWRRTDLYTGWDLLIEVEPEYALNQHYKRCHFDEWDHEEGLCLKLFKGAKQDDIMLRYREQLLTQMAPKLEKLGLPPL